MIITTLWTIVVFDDAYYSLGAAAGQWDVSGQVRVVIGDGAGGAVELKVPEG